MNLSLNHSMSALRVTLVAPCLALFLACAKTEAKLIASKTSLALIQCVPDTLAGFDTPNAAFAAYTDALNRADFCKAIAFYESPAQLEAALSGFRMLVMLAGGQSPEQMEYQKRFIELCNHYTLNYGEQSAFVGLFLSLLNDKDWQADIPDVRAVVEKDPASFYADVMRRIQSVSSSATVTIAPHLSDLTFDAEIAMAKATRSDGRVIPVSFRQTAQGWMLALLDD
ncbi:MAG TPA: hypothetical protein VFN67_01670 [Polyangiales bacterium]|nr:hypothetical protein [Polyangiales bacterium]